MNRLFTLVILSFALLLGTVLAQSPERPGEGTTVRPAVATWESARPIEMTLRVLLEELGYSVGEAVSLANPLFFQAVSDGDVDYWGNGWFPMHRTQTPDHFEANATLAGAILPAGGLEGYLVDKATAEELNITSLEDFRREEVKAAFDRTGDGKAELVACPPGWGCEINIEHHMDAYDLRDHINLIKADYTASFADALARYESGESIFYYTWAPNFTIFLLEPGVDVVWIEVPFSSLPDEVKEFEADTIAEGVVGCVADPCNIGWVANDITIVGNIAFLEANPAIASLFGNVRLDLGMVSELTARINDGEDSNADVRAMVEAWLADNQELVDSWLAEARAAAQ